MAASSSDSEDEGGGGRKRAERKQTRQQAIKRLERTFLASGWRGSRAMALPHERMAWCKLVSYVAPIALFWKPSMLAAYKEIVGEELETYNPKKHRKTDLAWSLTPNWTRGDIYKYTGVLLILLAEKSEEKEKVRVDYHQRIQWEANLFIKGQSIDILYDGTPTVARITDVSWAPHSSPTAPPTRGPGRASAASIHVASLTLTDVQGWKPRLFGLVRQRNILADPLYQLQIPYQGIRFTFPLDAREWYANARWTLAFLTGFPKPSTLTPAPTPRLRQSKTSRKAAAAAAALAADEPMSAAPAAAASDGPSASASAAAAACVNNGKTAFMDGASGGGGGGGGGGGSVIAARGFPMPIALHIFGFVWGLPLVPKGTNSTPSGPSRISWGTAAGAPPPSAGSNHSARIREALGAAAERAREEKVAAARNRADALKRKIDATERPSAKRPKKAKQNEQERGGGGGGGGGGEERGGVDGDGDADMRPASE